jgi:aminopeptidase-like protein
MMGTDGDFVVASTFNGGEILDRAFRHVVKNHTRAHRFVGFRESVGNDETVWEAPGIEIPCVQVNRFRTHSVPFPEYHTNFDNADLMDAEQLEEFLDVFKKVVQLLETNVTLHRKFDGLIALSNPKYDIYLERFDPTKAAGTKASYSNSWGILQDSIPRYFDGRMSVLDIAEKHDIDFFEIRSYVQQFIDKELVDARFEEMERPRTSRFGELD